MEKLLSFKTKANQARFISNTLVKDQPGDCKPRDEQETLILALLSINRLKKAIDEKKWVLEYDESGKWTRKIKFNG